MEQRKGHNRSTFQLRGKLAQGNEYLSQMCIWKGILIEQKRDYRKLVALCQGCSCRLAAVGCQQKQLMCLS